MLWDIENKVYTQTYTQLLTNTWVERAYITGIVSAGCMEGATAVIFYAA